MPNKNKNYIDVLESFKKEKEQQLKEEKEAKAKQIAKDKARRDRALRPAVELFEQLFKRYKNDRTGPALYRESATSLEFTVHGGYMCAIIEYRVQSPGAPAELGLRTGFKAAASPYKPRLVKVVPENEVHNLFPELLAFLAEMEIKYPKWAPEEDSPS